MRGPRKAPSAWVSMGMCLQIMLVGSAWECVCRSCWLGLQLLPNSGSCGELMPCWWIVGTLGTVSNAAFSLLPCSLPDSPLLELWAFFPFFCRLWTEGQTHSQAARRHFFPWVITVLDMTKFVQVCNGSNVPRCPRGCEGMKGSMHPHVLKWSVSLSRETSTVGRNPAQRRPCSPESVWGGGSPCPWMEWGTAGPQPTYLSLSSAPSFSWAWACPWLLPLFRFFSLIFPQASVSGTSSPLQSANPAGSFANLLSMLYLWRLCVSCFSPRRSGMWRKMEVQGKLQIRRQWK